MQKVNDGNTKVERTAPRKRKAAKATEASCTERRKNSNNIVLEDEGNFAGEYQTVNKTKGGLLLATQIEDETRQQRELRKGNKDEKLLKAMAEP